ncbi:MAG: hypothetical protein ACKVRN_04255 [Pyrinomonadaceae bacterium]
MPFYRLSQTATAKSDRRWTFGVNVGDFQRIFGEVIIDYENKGYRDIFCDMLSRYSTSRRTDGKKAIKEKRAPTPS